MKIAVATKGRATPKKGSRIRLTFDNGSFVYLVTDAEEPTELDDLTAITEIDIQPTDASNPSTIINAKLVSQWGKWHSDQP